MNLGDVVMLIVMVIGFISIGLIKKTPEYMFKRNLEKFKNELQQDLERIRIAAENIHPMKIEEYVHFTQVYVKMMELGKIQDQTMQMAAQKVVFDGLTRFGFSAFLFGSDQTVKKYVEIRKYSTLPQGDLGENEKAKILLLMSELMVYMRNDLGNDESSVSVDDFLMIIVNNWGDSQEEFRRKASNARIL